MIGPVMSSPVLARTSGAELVVASGMTVVSAEATGENSVAQHTPINVRAAILSHPRSEPMAVLVLSTSPRTRRGRPGLHRRSRGYRRAA